MKKIFALLALMLLPVAQGFTQESWQWQNPIPQGNDIFDVYMLSSQTAYAAGDAGTILKTLNSGQTWEILPTGTNERLYSVWFVTEQTGWCAGESSTILKTEDGGITWQHQETPQDSLGEDFDPSDPLTYPEFWSYKLYSLFFLSDSIGWAAGYKTEASLSPEHKSGILKTTDGGNTWVEQETPTDTPIKGICFTDSMNGWAAGGNYNTSTLLHTADGGETWQEQGGMPTYTGDFIDFRSVCFPSEDNGWIAGGDDLTMMTTDGGETWSRVDWSFTDYKVNPRSVYFTDDEHGWVAGKYLLHTDDGGNSWTEQMHTPGGQIRYYQSVHAFNINTVMAAGPESDLRFSTDSGSTWEKISSGPTQDLSAVSFVNMNTGWAVGDDFVVLKTVDGGENWQSNYYDIDGSRFTDVCFVNESVGWITCGMYSGPYLNGVVLKSIDGGYGWQIVTDVFRTILYSVYFINEQVGWASGADGCIKKTSDSGVSWTDQANPFTGTGKTINSIYFVNADTGWACVNSGGSLIHTTDGGSTWQEQATGTDEELADVWFSDTRNGWCVGGHQFSHGVILRTRDSGETWDVVMDTVGHKLTGIRFACDTKGWASGYDGCIIATSDGGETWAFQETGCSKHLNGIACPGQAGVWAAGNCGTILAMKAGSQNRAPEFSSPETVSAKACSLFTYVAHAADPDEDDLTYTFHSYPYWLTPGDTSISGTVPADAQDTSFTVTASDGQLTDTLVVELTVIQNSAVSRDETGVPAEFCVQQNYPNPFNPVTTIRFGITKVCNVCIDVFDITGKHTKNLYRGMEKAGYHDVVWDASTAASGTYIIRVQAGSKTLMRKCVLLK